MSLVFQKDSLSQIFSLVVGKALEDLEEGKVSHINSGQTLW